MKKAFQWIGILAAVLIVIGIISGKDEPTASESAVAATPAAPPEPPQKVSASGLLKAYKDNEIAANEKYKGKRLIVSARIGSTEAGMGDEPYLVLNAGGEYEFSKPQAHLAEDQHGAAASLKKGQAVTLECIGNSEVAGTPMLKDCRVQSS